MLRRIVPTFLRVLVDLWDNILNLVVANLIWSVSLAPAFLSVYLPIPAPFNLLLALLALVLVTGPTTIGLFAMTSNVRREERLEMGDFFGGVKTYYRRGWFLAGVNILFVIIGYFNIGFYSGMGFPGNAVPVLWLWLFFFWFMLQIYLWPLAVRLEGGFQVRMLFRNAGLASFKYLGYSLVITIVLLIGLVASYYTLFLPTVFIGMSLHTLLCNRALQEVLDQEREKAEVIRKTSPGEDDPLAMDVHKVEERSKN